jgi:hypothetical protein
MFTTNKVYRYISPWVLSVLSAGLLTPRRKFVTDRMFPTECPYRSGWQSNDSDTLVAVAKALAGRLPLGPAESLVLLQQEAATGTLIDSTFAFEGGQMQKLAMTDSPEMVAAILCSVGLACCAAALFAFGAYWLAAWGASNFHKRTRSKDTYRALNVSQTGCTEQKEQLLENRRSAAKAGAINQHDDDQLPSPLELLAFVVEEQGQKLRFKVVKILSSFAKEPKQGRAKPKCTDEQQAASASQPRELRRMDIVLAKKAKFSLFHVPHPLQIPWMLSQGRLVGRSVGRFGRSVSVSAGCRQRS